MATLIIIKLNDSTFKLHSSAANNLFCAVKQESRTFNLIPSAPKSHVYSSMLFFRLFSVWASDRRARQGISRRAQGHQPQNPVQN